MASARHLPSSAWALQVTPSPPPPHRELWHKQVGLKHQTSRVVLVSAYLMLVFVWIISAGAAGWSCTDKLEVEVLAHKVSIPGED